MSETNNCKHMDDCAMYQLFTLSGTLAVWQTRYCQAEFEKCERYKKTARGEPVPNNLMPNGRSLNK
jgi:hypothetical protein